MHDRRTHVDPIAQQSAQGKVGVTGANNAQSSLTQTIRQKVRIRFSFALISITMIGIFLCNYLPPFRSLHQGWGETFFNTSLFIFIAVIIVTLFLSWLYTLFAHKWFDTVHRQKDNSNNE